MLPLPRERLRQLTDGHHGNAPQEPAPVKWGSKNPTNVSAPAQPLTPQPVNIRPAQERGKMHRQSTESAERPTPEPSTPDKSQAGVVTAKAWQTNKKTVAGTASGARDKAVAAPTPSPAKLSVAHPAAQPDTAGYLHSTSTEKDTTGLKNSAATALCPVQPLLYASPSAVVHEQGTPAPGLVSEQRQPSLPHRLAAKQSLQQGGAGGKLGVQVVPLASQAPTLRSGRVINARTADAPQPRRTSRRKGTQTSASPTLHEPADSTQADPMAIHPSAFFMLLDKPFDAPAIDVPASVPNTLPQDTGYPAGVQPKLAPGAAAGQRPGGFIGVPPGPPPGSPPPRLSDTQKERGNNHAGDTNMDAARLEEDNVVKQEPNAYLGAQHSPAPVPVACATDAPADRRDAVAASVAHAWPAPAVERIHSSRQTGSLWRTLTQDLLPTVGLTEFATMLSLNPTGANATQQGSGTFEEWAKALLQTANSSSALVSASSTDLLYTNMQRALSTVLKPAHSLGPARAPSEGPLGPPTSIPVEVQAKPTTLDNQLDNNMILGRQTMMENQGQSGTDKGAPRSRTPPRNPAPVLGSQPPPTASPKRAASLSAQEAQPAVKKQGIGVEQRAHARIRTSLPEGRAGTPPARPDSATAAPEVSTCTSPPLQTKSPPVLLPFVAPRPYTISQPTALMPPPWVMTPAPVPSPIPGVLPGTLRSSVAAGTTLIPTPTFGRHSGPTAAVSNMAAAALLGMLPLGGVHLGGCLTTPYQQAIQAGVLPGLGVLPPFNVPGSGAGGVLESAVAAAAPVIKQEMGVDLGAPRTHGGPQRGCPGTADLHFAPPPPPPSLEDAKTPLFEPSMPPPPLVPQPSCLQALLQRTATWDLTKLSTREQGIEELTEQLSALLESGQYALQGNAIGALGALQACNLSNTDFEALFRDPMRYIAALPQDAQRALLRLPGGALLVPRSQ